MKKNPFNLITLNSLVNFEMHVRILYKIMIKHLILQFYHGNNLHPQNFKHNSNRKANIVNGSAPFEKFRKTPNDHLKLIAIEEKTTTKSTTFHINNMLYNNFNFIGCLVCLVCGVYLSISLWLPMENLL